MAALSRPSTAGRSRPWWTGQVHPLLVDGTLAAVVAVFTLAELYRPLPAGSPLRAGDAVGTLLALGLALPLVARRRFPRVVGTAVLVAAALVAAGGYRQSTLGIPLSVALYTVGSRCDLLRSAPVLVGAAALMVETATVSPERVGPTDVAQAVVTLAVSWWLGATVRVRAAYARALEERTALLRQVQDQAAAGAVTRERLRIARELHDVVAHSMSVVAVQSGVAMHVLDSRPDQARSAVESIVTTSRSALVELRRLLGVLREDGTAEGALTPAPGLADLERLGADLSAAGLPVRIEQRGEPRPLSPALELTGYRIVQEALTNTVKHAGVGVTAEVVLTHRPDRLEIEVRDRAGPALRPDRPRPPSETGAWSGAWSGGVSGAGSGAGLTGMRERVAGFGGTLEAGPTGDGFRVRATLPLQDAAPDAGRPPGPGVAR